MQNVAKNFMYIGLALIVMSIVMMGFNFDKIIDSISKNAEYETKEIEVEAGNLNNIVIKSINADVKVVPTNEDKIKITYYETKYLKYEQNNDGNTFSLEGEQKGIFPFSWFFFWKSKTMKIEVPLSLVLDFNIKTSNGKMEVNNLDFSNLEFRTSNGSIELTDVDSSNDITLNTSNGSVIFKQVTAKDLIDMRTSNGSINLDNVNSSIINGHSSNGRIVFDSLKATDITFRTSNGRIEGNVVGENKDYAKYMRTSNGHVTIDGNRVDKTYQADRDKNQKVDLSTSNGSIDLEFK